MTSSIKEQLKTPRYMHNWTFLFYIYCFNKRLSINGGTQKHQKILLLKLSSHLTLKQIPLNSYRRDVLSTDILTQNPTVSNNSSYAANGHLNNISL